MPTLQITWLQGSYQQIGKHKTRNSSSQKFTPIIRRCVLEVAQQGIIIHCYENACGGHFASQKTSRKVLQSGFHWPSLFKDAHTMCKKCDKCQRLRKISRRHMMPLNPILVVDLFDVWGIDFMGPFPSSLGYL